MKHLEDLRDALDGQLEHVDAKSIAGLFWQIAQLGILFDCVAEDLPGDPSSHAHVRAFQRLHHQVIGGLERVGGIDGHALGAGFKIYRGGPIDLALSTLDHD